MKRYLSALLCISLLLMATGCNNESSKVEFLEEAELTKEDYLALYDQYLNEDHNIVFVKNLLEKAHNEIDDEEIKQLYADFQSRSLNNGEYTFDLEDAEGTLYDYYRGFRYKYWDYADDFRDRITDHDGFFEPPHLSNYPTLCKHDEDGTITDIYIIDIADLEEEGKMHHLSLLQDGVYVLDDNQGEMVLDDARVSSVSYDGIERHFIYNERGHLAKIEYSNGRVDEYIYHVEPLQIFLDKVIRDGVEYRRNDFKNSIKDVKYGVLDTEVIRNYDFEYKLGGMISIYRITSYYPSEDKTEVEEYRYRYNDQNLLKEQLVVDGEGNPINKKTIEYSEDGLTVTTKVTDGINDTILVEYVETFNDNHQLVKHEIISGDQDYDIRRF